MKLLAFVKVYSLQLIHCLVWKAFRADIFKKIDLENDLLTMTFMYNHLKTSAIHSDTLKPLL